MNLTYDIQQRLKTIKDRVSNSDIVSFEEKQEIDYRLKRVVNLIPNITEKFNDIYLYKNPHLISYLLFELDRCQFLIEHKHLSCKKYYFHKQGLIVTILRRLISLLLYYRGNKRGFTVFYDTPMLSEILYIHSPKFMLYFFNFFLPKKRRKWISIIREK